MSGAVAHHQLAQQINRWPNGLVLISHDRGLLEHVNEIVGLSPLGLAVYGGNYSQYAAVREQEQQSFQSALLGELIRSCHVGWLDQHAGLQYPERTAVQWLYESKPELPEAEARTRLAQMGIDADRATLKTCQLSGGERLKIALAAQLYAQRPPQLLLLDEPDNHLDLPSKIALEQMLNQYQGALIVVSHDSAFLQAIHLDAEFHLNI